MLHSGFNADTFDSCVKNGEIFPKKNRNNLLKFICGLFVRKSTQEPKERPIFRWYILSHNNGKAFEMIAKKQKKECVTNYHYI